MADNKLKITDEKRALIYKMPVGVVTKKDGTKVRAYIDQDNNIAYGIAEDGQSLTMKCYKLSTSTWEIEGGTSSGDRQPITPQHFVAGAQNKPPYPQAETLGDAPEDKEKKKKHQQIPVEDLPTSGGGSETTRLGLKPLRSDVYTSANRLKPSEIMEQAKADPAAKRHLILSIVIAALLFVLVGIGIYFAITMSKVPEPQPSPSAPAVTESSVPESSALQPESSLVHDSTVPAEAESSIAATEETSVAEAGSEESSDQTEPEESAAQVQPEKTPGTIEVIMISRDLLAGSEITPDNIQRVEITSEDYNSITLGGQKMLCRWEDYDSIMGQFVQSFIPSGQYLQYSDLRRTYNPTPNPWYNEEEEALYIPITLDINMAKIGDLCVGEKVTLSIVHPYAEPQTSEESSQESQEQTESEAPAAPVPDENGNITETFDVPVSEILNMDGIRISALVSPYFGMNEIALETYLRQGFENGTIDPETFKPNIIKIRLSSEQLASFGGDLFAKDVSFTITRPGTFDNEDPAKASYISSYQTVNLAIKTVLEK